MRLSKAVLRFERHLNGALKLKNKDISDYLIYNTLAMECFQAVNSLIEIGEYLVGKKMLGYPSTYREIITKDELNYTKRLIFLRNLIAHEYERISEAELLEMVDLLSKVNPFISRIKRTPL